jgi:TolB-like protein/DNA-binding SARP family transcriptional activator/Flp pilus assembly protein TadD
MFRLRLFGGISLEGDSGPLIGRAVQRRRLALLAILALEHPRPVGRDKLTAWLWPENDTERARHLLRDSLYLLRNALGDECLLGAGDELRLNPQRLRCDVWDFEEALARGQPDTAVRVYAGPLLDGFHIGDALDLEHWLDAERERLARACAEALEQLAEEAITQRDTKSAVAWWRRLAAGDPYNSRITLRLMEALAAAGDRAGAIQQARIHATLLEQEFAAEPDPAVSALAERLRTDPAVRTTVDSGPKEVEAAGLLHAVPGADLPTPFAAPPTADAIAVAEAAPADSFSSAFRSQRRRLGRRAVVLPAALVLGSVLALRVVSLVPETSARPDAAAEPTAASPKAIAVLPCTNLSRDPEEEHFSDGLTGELTGVLAQVHSLQVVARTSAFAFKGENRDVREIGRALAVGTLVECSVRRAGERVRVTAQLIDAVDGFHLWADTYEREGTDVFAIQSDLALRIVRALEAELTPAERERIARRPTTSPEAHALYLKGRYFWNQRTSSGYARAIEYFERAIQLDPGYAAAYAGLAYVHSMQGLSGVLSPAESTERTRAAALQALELDDELAEAYTVLGGYYHAHAWDSEAAERAHLQALALDPSYPTARHWYANFLSSIGRLEEAIEQMRKAVELDPLDPHLSGRLGSLIVAAGRPEEALEHIRNALELDSTFWQAQESLGYYYETTGQFEEAVRAHRRAAELAGTNSIARVGLARILALAGMKNEARRILGELQAEAERTQLYTPGVAWVLVALDDREGALEWLERSYQQKHPNLRFIGRSIDPRLAIDPRYLDLRYRIGLPL